MRKAINLSLKATVKPYVKLVTWFHRYDFSLFCSSNIKKAKYNYPIGEIEWKYRQQLFQVQKGVYQVVKFNNSKRWQKQIIFMVTLSIKSVSGLFFIISLCAAVHVTFLDPTAHGKQSRTYELSTYMLTLMVLGCTGGL